MRNRWNPMHLSKMCCQIPHYPQNRLIIKSINFLKNVFGGLIVICLDKLLFKMSYLITSVYRFLILPVIAITIFQNLADCKIALTLEWFCFTLKFHLITLLLFSSKFNSARKAFLFWIHIMHWSSHWLPNPYLFAQFIIYRLIFLINFDFTARSFSSIQVSKSSVLNSILDTKIFINK